MSQQPATNEALLEALLDQLLAAAAAMAAYALDAARHDDPHRLRTLGRDFDKGVAAPMVTVAGIGGPQHVVSVRLSGQRDGEPYVVGLLDLKVVVPDAPEVH